MLSRLTFAPAFMRIFRVDHFTLEDHSMALSLGESISSCLCSHLERGGAVAIPPFYVTLILPLWEHVYADFSMRDCFTTGFLVFKHLCTFRFLSFLMTLFCLKLLVTVFFPDPSCGCSYACLNFSSFPFLLLLLLLIFNVRFSPHILTCWKPR